MMGNLVGGNRMGGGGGGDVAVKTFDFASTVPRTGVMVPVLSVLFLAAR